MFHDDLSFDDEFFLREPPIGTECERCKADNQWCFTHENEAEMTAEAVAEWNQLARQRRAREAEMADDIRTQRLALKARRRVRIIVIGHIDGRLRDVQY